MLTSPLSATTISPGHSADTALHSAALDTWATTSDSGTFVNGSRQNITSADYSGVFRSAVYRNSSDFLDFYYHFVSYSSSTRAISGVTTVDFARFVTNVGWTSEHLNGITGSGAGPTVVNFPESAPLVQAPTSADRSTGAGRTIGFSLPKYLAGASVGPGETSRILVDQTNATDHPSGNISLLNGYITLNNSFAPTVIPEPGTCILMGVGLVALGLVRRKRQ
jgi:hypothetical protein